MGREKLKKTCLETKIRPRGEEELTMLKALRELVSATLLVEFNVMQLTIALKRIHTF